MSKSVNCIMNAVFFAIVLNIVLPMILSPFATQEEKQPSGGAKSLSMKSQFMHMMVHHQQVPVTSSLIVALIVALAIMLGYALKPSETIMKGFKIILKLF